MRPTVLHLLCGFLLGLAALPVNAQITVEPQSLSVTVAQYGAETRTVTLRNDVEEPLSFCVSFNRPLQRSAGVLRLAEGSAGADEPCGPYGEVLYRYDEEDFDTAWDPSSITMTPDGRLFTAETSGLHRTFEFTADLQLLRSFEHPTVAEFERFPSTAGVGYDTESGTLWWINVENTVVGNEIVTLRIMLIEGDLDGAETGRRIEIVPPEGPVEDFFAGGLSYDPATDLFYFLGISDTSDSNTRRLWAIDRTGTLAEGYPLRPEPYPPPALIGAPDAYSGVEGGPEGVRVEFAVYPSASAPGFDRVAVVDRWGEAQGEALETPVPAALFENGGYGVKGNSIRSRIDPNGVMYMTFTSFVHEGIVGVRPHPLPPSWLVVDSDAGPEAAWDGTVAPGESREIILTFRAGARAVGEYTSALQVFEAATGEAVEVPLTLTVTPGVDTEEETAPEEETRLTVYPNPARGAATVALTLNTAAEVRVAVYDVLGREVVALHDGPLAPGTVRLALPVLPAGTYLVRGEGGGFTAARRVTVVR